MKSEYTKGEWIIKHGTQIGIKTENTQYGCFDRIADTDVIGVEYHIQKANANRIVTAVNCHDELVGCLYDLYLLAIDATPEEELVVYGNAYNILNKAKAGRE